MRALKKKRAAKAAAKKKQVKAITMLWGLVVIASIAGLLGGFAMERDHAEDSEKHRSTFHIAEHGGIVRMVEHRKYELVVNADMVSFYVFEDRKPTDCAGGGVALVYAVASQTESVELKPVGNNKFEVRRPPTLTRGTKLVAVVNIPGRRLQQLEFTLDV